MVTQTLGKGRDTRRFEVSPTQNQPNRIEIRLSFTKNRVVFYLCLAQKYVTFGLNVTSDVMCKTV